MIEYADTAIVTCSCGKQTTVRFNEVVQRYVPADPAWKFSKDISKRMGWFCGEEGHYQERP